MDEGRRLLQGFHEGFCLRIISAKIAAVIPEMNANAARKEKIPKLNSAISCAIVFPVGTPREETAVAANENAAYCLPNLESVLNNLLTHRIAVFLIIQMLNMYQNMMNYLCVQQINSFDITLNVSVVC